MVKERDGPQHLVHHRPHAVRLNQHMVAVDDRPERRVHEIEYDEHALEAEHVAGHQDVAELDDTRVVVHQRPQEHNLTEDAHAVRDVVKHV